jgi:hypothetical protein
VRVTDQARRLADAFEELMKTSLPDLPADRYAHLAELVGPEHWRILAHSARTGFPSSATVAKIVRLLAARAEGTR